MLRVDLDEWIGATNVELEPCSNGFIIICQLLFEPWIWPTVVSWTSSSWHDERWTRRNDTSQLLNVWHWWWYRMTDLMKWGELMLQCNCSLITNWSDAWYKNILKILSLKANELGEFVFNTLVDFRVFVLIWNSFYSSIPESLGVSSLPQCLAPKTLQFFI